mmetsp:Transcript_47337/g.133150  ORF Transcript_47337/g.133150 Transcript_47337/m.133150 type:complete len:234 (+) Transcript_47337:370-1071(+)
MRASALRRAAWRSAGGASGEGGRQAVITVKSSLSLLHRKLLGLLLRAQRLPQIRVGGVEAARCRGRRVRRQRRPRLGLGTPQREHDDAGHDERRAGGEADPPSLVEEGLVLPEEDHPEDSVREHEQRAVDREKHCLHVQTEAPVQVVQLCPAERRQEGQASGDLPHFAVRRKELANDLQEDVGDASCGRGRERREEHMTDFRVRWPRHGGELDVCPAQRHVGHGRGRRADQAS